MCVEDEFVAGYWFEVEINHTENYTLLENLRFRSPIA